MHNSDRYLLNGILGEGGGIQFLTVANFLNPDSGRALWKTTYHVVQ